LLLWCGLVGLIVYLVRNRTPGPVEVAETFLALLGEGKADRAYKHTAPAMRAHTTAGMLTLRARQLGLNGYSHCTWEDVHIEDDQATLEGQVTTKNGAVIAVVVKLVRQDDQWRVLSIAADDGATSPDDG
jgi:hypothetical protein